MALKELVLDPLQMRDTSFHVQGEAMARFARPASNDPDLWVFEWLDVTKAPKRFSGGAGMASTAADYHRVLQMLMNGGALDGVRLLSPMTVRWAMANHIGTMRGVAHPGDGYSWNLFNPVRVADGGAVLPRQHRRHLLGRHHRPALFPRSQGTVIGIVFMQAPSQRAAYHAELRALVYGAFGSMSRDY